MSLLTYNPSFLKEPFMMPSESLLIIDPAQSSADEQLAPFNPRTAAPFVNKSISEETRRLYHRVIRELSIPKIQNDYDCATKGCLLTAW